MTKKAIIITVPILASLLLVYLFLPSDTKRIREIIYDGRDAIVRKDLERVMAHVSYNYRDRYGFTYLYIKENLKSLFQRTESFEIELDNLRVEVNDKKAEARFLIKVKALETAGEVFLLGSEDVYESVFMSLEKERLKWLVTETYFPTREGIAF